VSLRRRLVLLAAGTVGVVVLVAALATYAAMRAGLRDQVDDTLREQAGTIRGTAAAFGRGRGHRDGPGPGPEISIRDLPPDALRVPPPRLGEAAGLVQVVGADGTLRRAPQTEEADVTLPITRDDLAVAAGERGEVLSDRTVGGEHLRILTARLGDRPVAVQLARSLESTDSTLARLRVILALLVVVATAFALAVSRLFARKVVAPVTALTEAAEHISATDDLGRRIDASGDDEVGRMAQRFNAMLDRLQGSRDALAASAAAQRQLVADASHELRTPVTSLRTNIEVMLAGGAPDEAERHRMLSDVRDQAEELTALINDVIELARGDQPLGDAVEDVRLDEVVEEAVERARRHAPGVAFAVTAEPLVVAGAGDRLGRAIGNLLVNAAGHSPPDGTVDVRLADGVLEVRDHGPGVEDADKPHVFDRFYRGATARGRPGSGLGLAIVRQAAEAHGGTVEVDDAPGGGAVFRLRLPTTPAGRRDSAAAPLPAG
jgi:two-component system sensor histidine kinase MprB